MHGNTSCGILQLSNLKRRFEICYRWKCCPSILKSKLNLMVNCNIFKIFKFWNFLQHDDAIEDGFDAAHLGLARWMVPETNLFGISEEDKWSNHNSHLVTCSKISFVNLIVLQQNELTSINRRVGFVQIHDNRDLSATGIAVDVVEMLHVTFTVAGVLGEHGSDLIQNQNFGQRLFWKNSISWSIVFISWNNYPKLLLAKFFFDLGDLKIRVVVDGGHEFMQSRVELEPNLINILFWIN